MKLKDFKARAPLIPDETCPVIDLVAALIKDETTLATYYLEKVRDDNAALRASSLYWYRVAQGLLEGK